MNEYRQLLESLEQINEMEMPTYRWEDAIEHAREAIRKSNNYDTEMLILQGIGENNADTYEVVNADAYMHWGQDTRDFYKIVGRVDSNGGLIEEDVTESTGSEGVKSSKHSLEDAVEHAREAIRQSKSYGAEVLILQLANDPNSSYYIVNADAYMHWDMEMRERYEIVRQLDYDSLKEDYNPMQADEVPPAPKTDPMDLVTMDVPLLIRLFELMNETVEDDAELHHIATRILEVSKESDGPLTMEHYNDILNGQSDEPVDEVIINNLR